MGLSDLFSNLKFEWDFYWEDRKYNRPPRQTDFRNYYKVVLRNKDELIILCDNLRLDGGYLYAENTITLPERTVRTIARNSWTSYGELPKSDEYKNVIS